MIHRLFTKSVLYLIGFSRGLYLHLPILTLYLLERSVTPTMIVFSAMFYSVGLFLFEVPTGYFADRYGQKLSMVIGQLLEAAGIVLLITHPTPIGVSLSYLFGGIAYAFLSGSEEALIYENTKEQGQSHSKVYGRFMSATTIGMTVATTFGGFFYALQGLSVSVLLLSGTFFAILLAAFLTLFLSEAKATKEARIKGSNYWQIVLEGFHYIWQEPLLRSTMFVSMLIITGEWFLYNVYQPIFESASVPPMWFGLSISLGMIGNAIVMSQIWRIEKWLVLEYILFGSSILLVVGYGLIALVPTALWAVLGVILVLTFAETYRPVLSDYLNDRIPTARRATILSSISFTQRIASTALRLLLTGAIVLWGFEGSVLVQGGYLLIGSFVSLYLLKHCGCTHRIRSAAETILPEMR
jgi:MFS family permease